MACGGVGEIPGEDSLWESVDIEVSERTVLQALAAPAKETSISKIIQAWGNDSFRRTLNPFLSLSMPES